MHVAGPALSRRTFLVTAAGAVALVACGGRRAGAPASGPDAAALDAAIAEERSLVAGYGVLAPTDADAAAARDDHAAHLAALLDRRGPTATPPTVISDPVSTEDLRKIEAASGPTLRTAATAARDGATAALLASVAASHTAHADTGRRSR